MVDEIRNKVLHSVRDISIKNKENVESDQIRVVSTFQADEDIVNCVKNSEEGFKQTPSFRNTAGKLFTLKKVGPNIKCQVNNLKNQALGTKRGGVVKCKGRGCKCCGMLNSAPSTAVNERKVRLANGSCKTNNICYLAVCEICSKPYTGRTVDHLHNRVAGHGHKYVEITKK